ncbi:hypothetical protein H708_00186, partial [Bartonella bacilliformis VAB9028]
NGEMEKEALRDERCSDGWLSGMQAKGEYLSREQESGENVHGGT